MDDSENKSSNPRIAAGARTIGDIVEARLSRRGFIGGLSASAAALSVGCATSRQGASVAETSSAFSFTEIARGSGGDHQVPEGYVADLVLRWGDAVFPDAPAFDPYQQTATAQERQFGYNNDFIGFYPLNLKGAESKRGLLCINHEYTSTRLMLPGLTDDRPLSREECEVEMAAHGGTVIEIEQDRDQTWRPVLVSEFNRRITAGSTQMKLTGPAAGSDRLKTGDDATGREVVGTMNNCAGGITPWGTYLMAEENFNGNFLGALEPDHPEAGNHKRYGVPGGWYAWGRHFDRFDVSKVPNEPNRYGWVVEVDILDPASTRRKSARRWDVLNMKAPKASSRRTVGSSFIWATISGSIMFTSSSRRALLIRLIERANLDLLDEGTLYVARFDAKTACLDWMALNFGEGPLTPSEWVLAPRRMF